MADPQWISVGRIRGSHGVHGALKIEPFSHATDSVLCRVRRWRLVEPVVDSGEQKLPGDASAPSRKRPLNLPMILRAGRCRVQGDALVAEVVLLDGHPPLTREQAMALKGVEIQVDRADFPKADADEFYHADLIGCEVIGQGDARLGLVAGVDDHGAQQVLRLADDMLIPFVKQIVLSVDLDARQIRVDWAADWR
ncbi:MAG: ribosome maturation factor RimM [Lautropia sp.]|nr:ribosome maturation factor RimM [Lautropia sp.]